tara:strand:- start:169 stop:594 length:426 start_codon:yes stop_codon:yes gene_type:complete
MNTESTNSEKKLARGPSRYLWMLIGCISVIVGAVGVVVPGLPTTVFMIIAASCFARSNPRFEKWILNLPTIGPLVKDYRNGLGMPRKAKIFAVTTISVVCCISSFLLIENLLIRIVVLVVGIIGICFILLKIPTQTPKLSD